MSRRRRLEPPVIPARPLPASRQAWIDEVMTVAAMHPRPEPIPAAIAARGWLVSATFVRSLTALAEEDAHRLAEVWDDPAEMPTQAVWAARYLAGLVHLGHLSPPEAVATMVVVVEQWGGTPVSVEIPDPEPVDAGGYTPDFRGRA